MNAPRETTADAALHLLWAIDGGYFSDSFLPDSAFVTALRIAVEAETGKSGYPRLAAEDQRDPVAVVAEHREAA